MSYCSNCGGRLNDQGLCPICGGMSEATVKPKQKNDSEVVECLRETIFASPLKGVEKAARTRSASVWVTFGAAFIISSAAAAFTAVTTLPPAFFGAVYGENVAATVTRSRSAASDSMVASFAGLLGHAVVLSLLSVMIVAAIAAILFTRAEEKPSVTQALNISTFSMLPLTLCLLVANPLSLLSVSAAFSLLLSGLAVSAVMFYFGVQKVSVFKKSPFWLFVAAGLGGLVLWQLCSFGLQTLLF